MTATPSPPASIRSAPCSTASIDTRGWGCDSIRRPRVRVRLRLRAEDGLVQDLAEIERYIVLDRLRVIHTNDSKTGLDSGVDRHENIGQGLLGDHAFRHMLAHPVLAELPWVLEVPGFDDKGPDDPNVRALKRLAGSNRCDLGRRVVAVRR
jgi:hypothetical protein